MMLSVFCSPSRYTQGKNATAALGVEMIGLGMSGPALIVSSRSPIRLLSTTWKSTLREAGVAYVVHAFGGECSLAEIERIKQVANQHKSQVIIGAGGGKVLDTARAAAAGGRASLRRAASAFSRSRPAAQLGRTRSDQ